MRACGDGVVNAAAGEDCDTLGESETCDDDCTFVSCGDGNVNEAAGELCDDNNLIELFFDVNPPKLKAWLGKPSTQEMFKKHNFVPTRYTFEPLQMG